LEELSSLQTIPDINTSTVIIPTIEIDKETRNTIYSLSGDQPVELLLKNIEPNGYTLRGIYIPEIAVYTFKQNDINKNNISELNSDLKLKCFSFLKIPAEKYSIGIYQLNTEYWMLTGIDIGVKYWLFENIQVVNDENLII